MIYLRAGVYAEGPSDYDFLCRLVDRLLDVLGAQLFPSDCEIADTLGIDAPDAQGGRAERIAGAIVNYADICELFVIHADGDSDAAAALEQRVVPGVEAARASLPERAVIAVACVPVREIEAWLLTDPNVFRELLGKSFDPRLPVRPDRERDPKEVLRRVLEEGGWRRRPAAIHTLFGERVSLTSLRTLPAFQAFEAEVSAAIVQVARAQGWPA